jgi:putative oxidoreductase
MTRARVRLAVRVLSGAVFVAFGLGKFVSHASELASFRSYGLPEPGLFVVVIGLIELVGGACLLAGRLVPAVALVLAGDMAGAIVVSGVARGEIISLTLAPALLLFMVALLVDAAGQRAARPALTRARSSGTATASTSPSASHPATMYGKRLKGKAGAGTRFR